MILLIINWNKEKEIKNEEKVENQNQNQNQNLSISTRYGSKFDLKKFKLVLFLFTSDTFSRQEEIYNDKVNKIFN